MTAALAVVFDFDGTIIDTETPVYESWAETYRLAGAEPIPLSVWLEHIGKADGSGLDVRQILCEQIGVDAVSAQVEDFRLNIRQEMLADQPLRPGVEQWIQAALQRSVPLAIASSSPTEWVQTHLERLDLAEYFPVVSCADPGVPGKPDPTVYLTACSGLGVEPTDALAIEDSTHGVGAAITAGLRCIAAPGPITKTMDFSKATLHVDDLGQVDPADWL